MSRAGLRGINGPIAAAIAAIPTTALECRRARAHWWDAYAAPYDRRSRTWTETQRCTRCTALRTTTVNHDGDQLDPWRYTYPDGYMVAGGLPDDARRALRAEGLRRQNRGQQRTA